MLFWKILENYGKFWKIEGFPILLLKTIKKPSIFQLFWDFQGSGLSEGMGMYRKPNSDLIISLKPKPLPHTRRAWDWTHLVSKSMHAFDSHESLVGLMGGERPYIYIHYIHTGRPGIPAPLVFCKCASMHSFKGERKGISRLGFRSICFL